MRAELASTPRYAASCEGCCGVASRSQEGSGRRQTGRQRRPTGMQLRPTGMPPSSFERLATPRHRTKCASRTVPSLRDGHARLPRTDVQQKTSDVQQQMRGGASYSNKTNLVDSGKKRPSGTWQSGNCYGRNCMSLTLRLSICGADGQRWSQSGHALKLCAATSSLCNKLAQYVCVCNRDFVLICTQFHLPHRVSVPRQRARSGAGVARTNTRRRGRARGPARIVGRKRQAPRSRLLAAACGSSETTVGLRDRW